MDRQLLLAQCEAYVLGLLDAPERAELEERLGRRDPEAVACLREANDLVAELAYSTPMKEPPTLLRSRLLHSLGKPPVVPARRNWMGVIGWAAAAAIALFALSLRQDHLRVQRELADSRQQVESLARQADQSRKVLAILMARDARMIRLSTSQQTPQFRAFWSQPEGFVLAGVNVPAPAAGRTMQLWVVPKKGNPISAGIFQPDASGQVLFIGQTNANPGDASALAISDEPAGGSPQPTTTPAWVGAVGD